MSQIEDLVSSIFNEDAKKRQKVKLEPETLEPETLEPKKSKNEPTKNKLEAILRLRRRNHRTQVPIAAPGELPQEKQIEDWMTEREKEEIIAHNAARARLIYEESLPAKERALRCLLFENAVRKGK